MQEDTPQHPQPQAMPPPPPQVVYVNPDRTGKSLNQKWPKVISMISIGVACLGVLPVLIFMISCIAPPSFYSTPGFSHFAFFFVGLVLHGIAGVAGLVGMLNGVRLAGLLGLIGNGIIILLAVLSLFIGVTRFS